MIDGILVPTDGSDEATAALEHAIELAADVGATVHVLFVVDEDAAVSTGEDAEILAEIERQGEGIVTRAGELAAERGADAVEAIEHGDPQIEILGYADREEVDLIVMGTQGRRGLRRLLLGSVAEGVLRLSEVPVLTVRAETGGVDSYPYGDVLVAIDGGEGAALALEEAIEWARAHGSRLHIVSVVDVRALSYEDGAGHVYDALESGVEGLVSEAAERAREAGVDAVSTHVAPGRVSREITGYAEEVGADLAIVGTHGRRGVDRVVLGSVAELVVRTADCPVLTVRRPDPE